MFGDRSGGAYLPKFVWTKIERHVLVQGAASPDDPALTDYWADRRRKRRPPLNTSTLRLLKKQNGRCSLCGDLLLHAEREPHSPEEWEQWHRTVNKAITRSVIGQIPNRRVGTPNDTQLIHRLPTPRQRPGSRGTSLVLNRL